MSVEGLLSPRETTLVDGLREQGATVYMQDLRLLSLPKEKRESFDAIWCSGSLEIFSIEEVQRVLQSFFILLKPRAGILALTYYLISDETPDSDPQSIPTAHRRSAIHSLLRQSGLNVFLEGSQPTPQGVRCALLARRV